MLPIKTVIITKKLLQRIKCVKFYSIQSNEAPSLEELRKDVGQQEQ